METCCWLRWAVAMSRVRPVALMRVGRGRRRSMRVDCGTWTGSWAQSVGCPARAGHGTRACELLRRQPGTTCPLRGCAFGVPSRRCAVAWIVDPEIRRIVKVTASGHLPSPVQPRNVLMQIYSSMNEKVLLLTAHPRRHKSCKAARLGLQRQAMGVLERASRDIVPLSPDAQRLDERE